jgi:hypothetical protein
MTLETDLQWLQANAFEFSLRINDDATFHTPLPERGAFEDDRRDDWLSDDQRTEGLRTGKFVSCRVYPNGSVGFFQVFGTDLTAVVASTADAARADKRPARVC